MSYMQKILFNVTQKTLQLSTYAILLTVFLISCKKSKSDIGALVFKETKNKVYKQIDSEQFTQRLLEQLDARSEDFSNPQFMRNYYQSAEYEPTLILNNLPNKGIYKALEHLSGSERHGLDSNLFQAGTIAQLLDKIYLKRGISDLEEAYNVLIDLELTAANAFSNYSNTLQYGLLNPFKIYAQYYTTTPRPDSTSFLQIFKSKELHSLLDSIQPQFEQYTSLQKELEQQRADNNLSAVKTLTVNLERLRWKNIPTENKYVWVNIPDFTLDVMENNKSILNMKVCVGESRMGNDTNQLIEYNENDLKDRPFSRETPQLKSVIHSVQVNPVWNIPESIATNEISKLAANDRYYLANNGIDVFKNGVLVENPELIDFNAPDVGKVYSFKQRPGNENSLGKIKFMFNNQSAVYLHDTPAKAAFGKKVRAVSHGCVRVEKPLELAKALFNSEKAKIIEQEMASDIHKAKDIALNDKIPVYLSYFTAWSDSNNTIQYRDDVYGLDNILYNHLKLRIKNATRK